MGRRLAWAVSVLALLTLVACHQGATPSAARSAVAVSPSPRVSSGRAPAGLPLVLFRRAGADAPNWDSGAAWDGQFYDLTKPVLGVVSADGEHLLDDSVGAVVPTATPGRSATWA